MNDSFRTPQARYFNRELSWLNFNDRVLDQACNPDVPLLERLKFLAISARNLDEFFRVRVGSLRFAEEKGSQKVGIAGMTVPEQLEAIRRRVTEMNVRQYSCFLGQLLPALEAAGVRRLGPAQLTPRHRAWLDDLFENRLLGLFDSIAAGRNEKFPWLDASRVCLCIRFEGGAGLLPELNARPARETDRFIVLELPEETAQFGRIVKLPQFEETPAPQWQYMLLEDIVSLYLQELFPEEKIAEWSALRVIRNADFALNEEADDFFQEMEQLLAIREESACVRLEISANASPVMRNYLQQELGILDSEIYSEDGPLDLGAFFALAAIPGFPGLRYPVWPATPLPEFQTDSSVFDVISERDRILVHPYQSYDPVVRFLEEAAVDPGVLAIKQTLYRTSRDSRIVKALLRAAANGKRVTVVVELKARFDEARNMAWAKQLERQNVNVVYGVRGLKTHAKLCLVIRDEAGGIRRYAHFATGNYNESTAGQYGDVSLFTCDPALTADALSAFNSITGLTVPQPMEKLVMAPVTLRSTLQSLINVEIEHAKGGLEARISAKLNSLVDAQIIDKLYEASQVGVQIRLNVRGACSLRPGIPGLSDNIRVISIVDRFLEHARILHFRHGGENRWFIASADWMTRNLDNRIELLVPVEDPACRQVLEMHLDYCFRDNVNCWEIQPGGDAVRLIPDRRRTFRSQEELWLRFQQQYQSATNPGTTVFKAIGPE